MSLINYLPIKSSHLKEKTTIISGRVPIKFAKEVRKKLKELGLSWSDFTTASCRDFLDEVEHGKKIK